MCTFTVRGLSRSAGERTETLQCSSTVQALSLSLTLALTLALSLTYVQAKELAGRETVRRSQTPNPDTSSIEPTL